MLQRCKSSLFLTCFLTLVLKQTAFASTEPSPDVLAFKKTWTSAALKLQREMDLNAPLTEATFLATHNSYNSSVYTIPYVRYIDPNQQLSLYDQLDMGARSIEIDTHWAMNNKFSKSILLCHGTSNHTGCSAFDRDVTEGLAEIRDWLRANPKEVILIYIERHLDGHEPRLAAAFHLYFRDLVFKPETLAPNKDKKTCMSLPGNISKADILKAGKQVILVAKGCDNEFEEQDVFKENWNNDIFAGIGDVPTEKNSFMDDKIELFTPYPDCGRANIFYPDVNHTSLWRVFEDRTRLSNIIYKTKPILDDDMRALMRCGTNWATMDMLSASDTRLTAAVWSWAANYPVAGDGACAFYEKESGIKNATCEKRMAAYACKEEKTHEIKAVLASGAWAQGEAMCQALAGKTWHFGTPVNGLQMTLLTKSLTPDATTVWLNYQADEAGQWAVKG